MTERWLQVTAGQGPAECAWAVIQVILKIQEEAEAAGLSFTTLDLEPGPQPATAESALVRLAGPNVDAFASTWRGTVQWIARSPYRPTHKRKNWFVGIDTLEPIADTHFDPHDVSIETMRASGPGGQHVNRTESAIRITHLPTGLQATASEERSQHRNRALALARLAAKVDAANAQLQQLARSQRWQAHQALERGNPVRIYREGSG